MNITHAEHEEINGDKLEAMFNRQKELMGKYHDIEKRSGLMQTEDCPVNLDDKRGQARIKDFCWRVIEEVGEALDAHSYGDMEHFQEELIDGLHFLTELTILSGVSPSGLIPDVWYDESMDKLEIIYNHCENPFSLEHGVTCLVNNLGMMCNCLKNKPWKQTNMVSDKNEYYKRLMEVWYIYINILALDMVPERVVDVYLRKSQVNKFRQRSMY